EVDHPKSITVVDMDAAGDIEVRRVPLVPPRDLRRVQGTLQDLVTLGAQGNREDYIVATLMDRGPVLYAMDRLREIYPNAIHVERPQWELSSSIKLPDRDHTRLSVGELFHSFFEEVTDEPLTEEETTALTEVLQSLRGGS
ncbi:MAG: exonuclease SbcCD subunit D C-terminal domain-containing protein, partial [Myxococcota bacterium]|nr:exonuclease SbcCD subunit D C-terminal domain-containing protein [Myxococcota bacterium]